MIKVTNPLYEKGLIAAVGGNISAGINGFKEVGKT